jgi:hypothetical protein
MRRFIISALLSSGRWGSKHLWNNGQFLPDYTAQHPRRQSSSSWYMNLSALPTRTGVHL